MDDGDWHPPIPKGWRMIGRPRTATGALRKCVKVTYGNWMLVQLPSGRWACIWAQVLGIESMCESVLDGTWFHDNNPDAATRAEALQIVEQGIEREIRDARNNGLHDYYQPILRRVRAAIARHSKQEA